MTIKLNNKFITSKEARANLSMLKNSVPKKVIAWLEKHLSEYVGFGDDYPNSPVELDELFTNEYFEGVLSVIGENFNIAWDTCDGEVVNIDYRA